MIKKPRRYGPYKDADGRVFFVDVYPNGKTVTSYPYRELVEFERGRFLSGDECVHHRNEDPADNRLENLEVTLLSEHARGHQPSAEMVQVTCPQCGKERAAEARVVRRIRKKGMAGPFCNKVCAGRYSALRGWATRQSETAGWQHGTRTGYDYHGCRCDECRACHAGAAREARLRQRHKKKRK